MLNITLKARLRTTVSVYWSVLSVLVSNIIPECIVHGKMSGGHYSLDKWLLMEQSQKHLRQSKTQDFFAAK